MDKGGWNENGWIRMHCILQVDEGGWNEYGWKRKIPASKFGQIVQAQGKRVRDKQFTEEILTYNGNLYN